MSASPDNGAVTESRPAPAPKYPSDATRAARRRARGARNPDHLRALNLAQQLQQLTAEAPDELTQKDLRRLVYRIRLRYAVKDHARRLAVLRVLESAPLHTFDEIVEKSGLDERRVRIILEDFASPAKRLVFSTKNRKGGKGRTNLLYGLAR